MSAQLDATDYAILRALGLLTISGPARVSDVQAAMDKPPHASRIRESLMWMRRRGLVALVPDPPRMPKFEAVVQS